ncbi:MAG: chorismate mutase [Gemmatimonadales bacterium]|nr:chorismate mutase [Gemmatimonadales bacterium]
MSRRRMWALRGATTVDADRADLVRAATRELLAELVARNGLDQDEIVSAIFSVTTDLVSEYPASGARELGWVEVPLLCTTEIPVPGGLRRVIRVLLHVEPAAPRPQWHPVYLRGATTLRPDLVAMPS